MKNKEEAAMFSLKIILIVCLFHGINACGITTHIEISHRAKTYFKDDSGAKIDYAKLILTHNDALMAGSPYPDAYYDSICANGQYHDVSEDTHWAPFVNASVNYINSKYPQPWDEATEKLVVFIFGVVSHQVADILWHSLGIDQGFLQAMAKINFHGKFDDAHPVGDFGGDILTEYEMDTSYIPLEEGWYIPTDDLFNIYNFFYGTQTKIPKEVIVACSGELFLERLAEAIGAKELFREYADQSPFLVDQFERYFVGGVDDMAGWTHRIWQETITMIEKGTGDCDIPRSTLFLHCNGTVPRLKGYRDPGKNGYFKRPLMNGVSTDDVVVEKTLRGIRIKPSKSYMLKLQKKKEKPSTLKFKSNRKALRGESRFPDTVLFVKNDYARLGEAYATGDLNFDGKEDLVITAPGYGSVGSPQEGRVYIIYGDDNGIPKTLNPDLDSLEATGQGQILKGWGTAQSRFGTSVAVMDINLDGADDIAVGAPAFTDYTDVFDSPLEYNGYVLIYFGLPKKKIVANGAANITITGKKIKYCNLGFSMTAGDVNNDGYRDLVIGTPFAPGGGEQQGFVTALFADVNNFGHQYMFVEQLPWRINGNQSYGWFGYDMTFGKWNNQNVLFVSQPEFRYCDRPDCTYVWDDIQSVGKLHAFYGTNLTMNWTAYGFSEFSQTGWSADIGSPYPDKNIQVIADSQLGEVVSGSVVGEQNDFQQVGIVGLYNTTSGQLPNVKVLPSVFVAGDRPYERFGYKAKFWDVNNDTVSDLFIGAPFRTEDFTEEIFDPEQGQVYIYTGGEHFPFKVDCGSSIINPCPTVQADFVLQWTGLKGKTRFGTNFAFLKSTNKRQVFVTAQHASDYARLGGAVGVFDF